MKKKSLLLCILAVMLVFAGVIAAARYFSIDKTAQRAEEGSFIIKGEKYIAVSIGYTKEGKTIAKAGNFTIMEIPEDKSHTFLAVRSGLDNWTIVKESYVIPTAGKLSIAYCNYERITDGEKHHMIQSILDEDYAGSFTVKTESEVDIHNATKDIWVGYGDCPVGTDLIGSIGNINGHLVFIRSEDMKDGDLQYTFYILKDAYQKLYDDSVKRTFETVTQ